MNSSKLQPANVSLYTVYYGKPLWTKFRFLCVYIQKVSYFICGALNFTYIPLAQITTSILIGNVATYSAICNLQFIVQFSVAMANVEVQAYSPILTL